MYKDIIAANKTIYNKTKIRGLQKLRWYCQACQKQCRDENGFKCHCQSESHQRQMLLFMENPNYYLDEYSSMFEEGYLSTLKKRGGGRYISANQIYQEYISDRHHVHMNSTVWTTLGNFLRYLEKEKKIILEETSRGIMIKIIETDPEKISKQQIIQLKEQIEMKSEERNDQIIKRQQQAVLSSLSSPFTPSAPKQLSRPDDTSIHLSISSSLPLSRPLKSLSVFNDDSSIDKEREKKKKKIEVKEEISSLSNKKYKDQEIEWIMKGLIVKIINQSVGNGTYFKKKAIIQEIVSPYVCLVQIKDPNNPDILKIDQNYLETVIPSIGSSVMIVKGHYRGTKGYFRKIDLDNYQGEIEIKIDNQSIIQIMIDFSSI